MRILLVEDDELVTESTVKALRDQRYVVDVATDGQAGLELGSAFVYDLLLLDVMLPKLNGIDLCRQLRSRGHQVPIILLTILDTSTDKVIGLDAGADDYVVKPFDLQELLARIRALLRRGGFTSTPILEWRNLRLDPSTCEVTYGAQRLPVTPKEYSLLELFLRNSRRVFSQSAILEHLWSFEEPQEDTVRAHIKGLRQKLKAAGAPADFIETVYGLGYRLKQPSDTEIGAPQGREPPVQQQTLAAVAQVWQRCKSKFSERAALLEQAAAAMLQGTLSNELRTSAKQEAHKLAGSLGMFGFKGSRLAQEIGQLLQVKAPLEQDQALRLSELVATLRRELQQTTAPGENPDWIAERPLLLVVDDDQSLAVQLALEADTLGMRVQVATELSQAREVIERDRPQAVLLNLCAPGSLEDSLRLLAELNTYTPPVPVLVLAGQDQLINRVQVARLGGRGFFSKPVAIAQLHTALSQLLQQSQAQASQVMVVDDDPQVLQGVRRLLEPWGIWVMTLDDPRRFWEVLSATAPELLILDVEMPHLSGIELCQVVRSDPHWSRLPVLVLSAHTDAETVNQVFAAGADDYVSKPIVGPELVTRIFNRLERSRLLRNLAEIDPLTGVANRRKSTQLLNRLLGSGNQHRQPLCLAVVELDNFQQTNEQYGYDRGEQMLCQVGERLRQAFA
ncbi:MAG TPA: response regulator, partial [Candidatus Caenarcaniphilales bacterium]